MEWWWIHRGKEEKPFQRRRVWPKERKGTLIIENKGEDKQKNKETV